MNGLQKNCYDEIYGLEADADFPREIAELLGVKNYIIFWEYIRSNLNREDILGAVVGDGTSYLNYKLIEEKNINKKEVNDSTIKAATALKEKLKTVNAHISNNKRILLAVKTINSPEILLASITMLQRRNNKIEIACEKIEDGIKNEMYNRNIKIIFLNKLKNENGNDNEEKFIPLFKQYNKKSMV